MCGSEKQEQEVRVGVRREEKGECAEWLKGKGESVCGTEEPEGEEERDIALLGCMCMCIWKGNGHG